MAIKTTAINSFGATTVQNNLEKEPTHLFALPTEILVKIQELIARNSLKDGAMMNCVCKFTREINQVDMGRGKTINGIIQEVPKINKEIDELTSSTAPIPTREEMDSLGQLIDGTKDMSEAMTKIKEAKVRAYVYLYELILKKDAPWPCKKYLFKSIPDESKGAFNHEFVGVFIRLAGKNGDLETAKKVYNEQTKPFSSFFAYSNYYSSMIYAAGEAHDLEMAKKAFNDIKSIGHANNICYYYFINAAGKNGDMQAATKAFNEAKSTRDVIVYLKFIEMAIKNDDWEIATQVFEEAKSVNLPNSQEILDSITLGTTDLSALLKKYNYEDVV